MTAETTVDVGKVYLVKIKEILDNYTSDDILWAVCHTGGDNIDYEDFKAIVTKLNGKGLYTPILSAERTTWKSLKNSADLKASCLIGDPILLLSGVTTFKKLLLFAYSQGILDNAKGQEFIAAKNEGLKEVAAAPRASKTLEEAMNDPSIGKRFGSSAEMVKDSLRQSANFAAEFGVQGAGHLELSAAAQQLVSLGKPCSGNTPATVPAAA